MSPWHPFLPFEANWLNFGHIKMFEVCPNILFVRIVMLMHKSKHCRVPIILIIFLFKNGFLSIKTNCTRTYISLCLTFLLGHPTTYRLSYMLRSSSNVCFWYVFMHNCIIAKLLLKLLHMDTSHCQQTNITLQRSHSEKNNYRILYRLKIL